MTTACGYGMRTPVPTCLCTTMGPSTLAVVCGSLLLPQRATASARRASTTLRQTLSMCTSYSRARRGKRSRRTWERSVGQPASQSVSQPASQSVSQPASQLVSQPVSQSVGQPASQSGAQGAELWRRLPPQRRPHPSLDHAAELASSFSALTCARTRPLMQGPTHARPLDRHLHAWHLRI